MNAPVKIDQIYALQRDVEQHKHRADNALGRLQESQRKLYALKRENTDLRALLVRVQWNGASYESVCTVCGGVSALAIDIVHSHECPVVAEVLI